MTARVLAFSFLVALPLATAAEAQGARQAVPRSPAFTEGYERGVRSGENDRRRSQAFSYIDDLTYRRATDGYRREYGSEDRYRDEFRRGYQAGYEAGYRGVGGYGNAPNVPRAYPPASSGPPAWSNGRGYGRGRGGAPPAWWNDQGPGQPGARVDLAIENGYLDGYEAGLDDGADRDRYNPIDERRFRNADHGYDRRYGPRELYRNRYREAFQQGYRAGYDDGRRYGNGRPWWWPW
jgi:hypothetical protein